MKDSKENIREIPNHPSFEGMAEYHHDVHFLHREEQDLKLQLMLPAPAVRGLRGPAPLIVFIQGSGWTDPNPYIQLPQLSLFAQRGYAVASIVHRSMLTAPFPACLLDVKAAIRFLRGNAGIYHIDPERVCLWGTSSGGNLALLTALTAEDPPEAGVPFSEQSVAVKAVVDCFGPTDLPAHLRWKEEHMQGGVAWVEKLIGGSIEKKQDVLRAMSPMTLLRPGLSLPPFQLLHGDRDYVAEEAQSLRFGEALRAQGYAVEQVRVLGAEHEGSFWSLALLELIFDFIQRHLGEP